MEEISLYREDNTLFLSKGTFENLIQMGFRWKIRKSGNEFLTKFQNCKYVTNEDQKGKG